MFKVTFWCCLAACDCHWLRLKPGVGQVKAFLAWAEASSQDSTLLQWHDHWSLITDLWAGRGVMYWQLLARAGIKESTGYDTTQLSSWSHSSWLSVSLSPGCRQRGQTGHIHRVTRPRAEPRGLAPGLQGVRTRVSEAIMRWSLISIMRVSHL